MVARSSKIPGARFYGKKNPDFLNFIGPVTPPWVPLPSQIMHMVSTEFLLDRAVFTKSIKVLGWQAAAPMSREHDFPKKTSYFFLKFIGPVTPLCVLYPSEIMRVGSAKPSLAGAVFGRSIKVLGW